jgi:maltose O-acetyltransferase
LTASDARSMKQRMLAGEPYLPGDPELVAEKLRCALLVRDYNATDPADARGRAELLERLLGTVGHDTVFKPPVYFNYGYQTTVGRNTFVNAGAMILDVGQVRIGDHVQIGPNVQLLTPLHPMRAAERRAGWETQAPITIADGAWLGGGVIVCAGVTIGEDAVIGAGTVVTRDVPAGVFAAGNPCRVIRALSE